MKKICFKMGQLFVTKYLYCYCTKKARPLHEKSSFIKKKWDRFPEYQSILTYLLGLVEGQHRLHSCRLLGPLLCLRVLLQGVYVLGNHFELDNSLVDLRKKIDGFTSLEIFLMLSTLTIMTIT
jgi:hypothetical protein